MADKTDTAWAERDHKLQKLFVFASFPDAMSFMQRVSYICEKLDHHPEWKNVYNRVSVSLSTHDAGDIVTDKDRELSRKMDEIAKQFVLK